MGSSLLTWLTKQPWFQQYVREYRPELFTNVDILCVDGGVKRSTVQEYSPKYFAFVAADGPVPFAKLPERYKRTKSLKAGGSPTWAHVLPSSLDTAFEKMKKLSATLETCHVVFSHKFVFGEADYKIGEFYRNWATSSKYVPGLTYIVQSCDSDVLLVTLGFHEQNCFFVHQNRNEVIDLGALRIKIAEEMGGGNIVRRVNDFRALCTLRSNDFHGGLSTLDLSEMIACYRKVTDPDTFLVDGDFYNLDVLQRLLKEFTPGAKGHTGSKKECMQYFRYMAWSLQLFNGFCPDPGFVHIGKTPSVASLLQHFGAFQEATRFDDQCMQESIPLLALKLVEEKIPKDAPELIRNHKDDVFAPILQKVPGKKLIQARTMDDVIEKYNRFIYGRIPEIDQKDYLYPMEFRRGEMHPVSLTKKDPDFEALFRIIPAVGSVVIFRNRAVGLFRQFLGGDQCCIQLYFLDIPDEDATGNLDEWQRRQNKAKAVYLGPIVCSLDDIQWKGHVLKDGMEPVNGLVRRGTTCISLNPAFFGVVGPLWAAATGRALLIVAEKQLMRPAPVDCAADEACVFDQFTKEELRAFAQEMRP